VPATPVDAEINEWLARGNVFSVGDRRASRRRSSFKIDRTDAMMASATATTNTSMSIRGDAKLDAKPSATTGIDSPTYAARKKPARVSARDSGGALSPAVARAPRKINPVPAPVTIVPTMNTARSDTHIPATSVARPASNSGAPARNSCVGVRGLSTVWANAPDANTVKATVPAMASDVIPMVFARKRGTRELKTPKTEKAARPARHAATN
jgi:hypothetical protein